jgi:hypothetical protein
MASNAAKSTTPEFVADKHVDATDPLPFVITTEHIKNAKCKDPTKCVIAQALGARFGQFFLGMEVGMTITKIQTPGMVTRFATPSKLRRQMLVFDKTGQWDLPPGEYTLLPPTGTKKLGGNNRWQHKKKERTGVQSKYKARALPSRRVTRIETYGKMTVV